MPTKTKNAAKPPTKAARTPAKAKAPATKEPRTPAKPRVVKSIQADAKKSGRSYVASLNDETKKFAYNHGIGWSDDDVSTMLNMVDKDETTYEMAIKLGRTFYSAQVARSHVSFASRHAGVFLRHLR